jgi:hypothetical protein
MRHNTLKFPVVSDNFFSFVLIDRDSELVQSGISFHFGLMICDLFNNASIIPEESLSNEVIRVEGRGRR